MDGARDRPAEPRGDEPVDATRRTRLANERTFLAWWRTGVTAIAAALAVGQLVPALTSGPRWPYVLLGAGFGLVAVAVLLWGLARYLAVERALDAGRFAPLDTRAAAALAGAGALLGVAVVAVILLVR